MNKAELVAKMAEEANLTKIDTKKALEAFMVVVAKEMKKEGKITLVGFGTFSITNRLARNGVNPKTGKPINIPAKKVVRFKPGSDLAL